MEVEAQRSADRRMARIGLVISVIFIVCQTGKCLRNIVILVNPPLVFPGWVWALSHLLPVINSSTNFLVYFTHSGGFRRKIRRFFKWKE